MTTGGIAQTLTKMAPANVSAVSTTIHTLSAPDNAWHDTISPNYIEWWYVDALFEPDLCLSGSFALWGNLQRPGSCVVRNDFIVANHKGLIADFGGLFPMRKFSAARERCDVRIGSSYLRDSDRGYELHLSQPGDTSLTLLLRPEVAGFGHIHPIDNDPARFFAWMVAVPRAQAQGYLRLGTDRIELNGIAYHDHNWASVSLSHTLKAWKWGRIHTEATTIIFARVEGISGPLFQGVAWLDLEQSAPVRRFLEFGYPSPDLMLHEVNGQLELKLSGEDVDINVETIGQSTTMVNRESGDYRRMLSQVRGHGCFKQLDHEIAGMMVNESKNLYSEG